MLKRWLLLGVLLLLLQLSALAVVYVQYMNRKLFAEWQTLQHQHDALLVQFNQLQLEQSTWSAPVWVEKRASELLQMQLPTRIEVIDY